MQSRPSHPPQTVGFQIDPYPYICKYPVNTGDLSNLARQTITLLNMAFLTIGRFIAGCSSAQTCRPLDSNATKRRHIWTLHPWQLEWRAVAGTCVFLTLTVYSQWRSVQHGIDLRVMVPIYLWRTFSQWSGNKVILTRNISFVDSETRTTWGSFRKRRYTKLALL